MRKRSSIAIIAMRGGSDIDRWQMVIRCSKGCRNFSEL